MHHGAIEWHRVHDLHFVGPPITKGARACAMFGDQVGHLVALKHMLKCSNAKIKFFRKPQQHQNFILAVTVAMDQALARKNFRKAFQLQITPRRHGDGALFIRQRGVVALLGGVLAGFAETVAQQGFNAHACVWIAPARTRDILAQGKFNSRNCVFYAEIIGTFAPL